MANDFSGFIIPEIPIRESAGINRIADSIQMNKEREYRQQKDLEADQWKKLNLIQDLTDISKHQTGSDVANAIGNKRIQEIQKKYIDASKMLSPAEIMAGINSDMGATVTAMDALKNELDLSDETLKAVKTLYPGIDISTLAKDHRTEILNRRINGNDFNNPLTVQGSSFDFSDPDVLSKYIVDDSALNKSITNPQGGEPESVLMGKQGDYTKFEGKLNYWKRRNYDREKFNSEGFYTGKDIPSFVTKGSQLSSESLPSSNGKPFMVIDKDVYDQFTADKNQRLSLIAATRRAYPDYDKFNPQEKEYAQRNILYNKVETLDPSQLHPTSNVRPPVTHVRVNNSESKKPAKIDLTDKTEYPDAGEGFQDVSRLFGGVKVTGLPNGSSLNAEYVKYNPSTGKIKYKEYNGDKERETDLTTFTQNIKTLNPTTDMKFLEGLKNPVTRQSPIRTPKDIKETRMEFKKENLRDKYGY